MGWMEHFAWYSKQVAGRLGGPEPYSSLLIRYEIVNMYNYECFKEVFIVKLVDYPFDLHRVQTDL